MPLFFDVSCAAFFLQFIVSLFVYMLVSKAFSCAGALTSLVVIYTHNLLNFFCCSSKRIAALLLSL